MLENIKVLCHARIRMELRKVIYTDPYRLKEKYNDADIILITHSHYDHFSEEDIEKVRKSDTKIVITDDLHEKARDIGFKDENIIVMKPYDKYTFDNIEIETIPAYNTNKDFHPKENNWIGYLLNINNTIYYVAGDTDITEENKKVKCDVAFIPVGGTYTMTSNEAIELVNTIKPKIAVPIHYGEIVGSKEDAINFVEHLEEGIKGEILMN